MGNYPLEAKATCFKISKTHLHGKHTYTVGTYTCSINYTVRGCYCYTFLMLAYSQLLAGGSPSIATIVECLTICLEK